ncbi:AraC family transcriptional regulator [Parabacteroides sp. An277]|uniref:helix-turn-helix domain-containing protein n=1 Tax=Parabacteroides sp. An277 TaxID=1965619 RepID=UPI000B39B92F|nr:helix-turn-helix transcriptional regulator [Parabacteroides sp. An277]OUO53381.1 AraC family transcriptional regulator [Parabacteroides sp. An277]
MPQTILHIKNMVCPRCIMAVRDVLHRYEIPFSSVSLGEATIEKILNENERENIHKALDAIGFELIEDKRDLTVENIKQAILRLVRQKNNDIRTNLSDYLEAQCRQDYSALSKLFSEVCGTTIEKYFIAQKIERVKELLADNELTLGEIADFMNYSSTAYLSAQFKQVVGMTPSQFKQRAQDMRKPIDQIL